jgi:hypothetical protein
MYSCKILEKNFQKGPCLFEKKGTIPGNLTCPQCSYYKEKIIINRSSITGSKKKTGKSKASVTSLKPPDIQTAKQEPWRAEATALPKNPFTEEQYQAMEKAMKPINGFDLRSKIEDAAINYLILRKQFEGKPRSSKVRKDLEKVRKLAESLSDLLHKKVDDDTLALLGGDIWEKIYNYEDDVYRISMRAWSQLRTFPSDPGGPRPWMTKGQKAYFQAIAAIYKNGTDRDIKRVFNPNTEKPTKEYKRILDFFRLCWEPINLGDKKLSDNAFDSKLRYYLELTKK